MVVTCTTVGPVGLMLCGVSTQVQSSGLVAVWNLALAVSVPFMEYMGAVYTFKYTYDCLLC